MPTGYTAKIADGITFKQYALLCARAFGACIELRDNPMDEPIPDEFNPSDYHSKAIADAEKRLAVVTAMSIAECNMAALNEYEERKRSIVNYMAEHATLKEKYDAMLTAVNAWQQPSSEHEGLKTFMREQIEQSTKYDCSTDYYEKELQELKPLSGDAWKSEEIAKCHKNLAYHTKENQKEIARAKSRTEWVNQLRDSLK